MNSILNEELIKLDFEAKDKLQAIEELAKLINEQGKLNDYELYIKHVLDREDIFPTSVGYSVAIPHGKSTSVDEACIAFGRLTNEIQWGEEEKIKFIFLIAVPESEAGDTHLKILAQISRKIMREEFRAGIENAQTKEELVKLFTE